MSRFFFLWGGLATYIGVHSRWKKLVLPEMCHHVNIGGGGCMSRFLLSSANSCVSIVLFVDHLLEIGMVTCSRLEIFNLPTPISNKKISNKKINTTTRLNRGPTIREIFWGCRFFFF